MGVKGGEDLVDLGHLGQALSAERVKLGRHRLVDEMGFGNASRLRGAQGGKLVTKGGGGAAHALQFQPLDVKLLGQPVDLFVQVALRLTLLCGAELFLQLGIQGPFILKLGAQRSIGSTGGRGRDPWRLRQTVDALADSFQRRGDPLFKFGYFLHHTPLSALHCAHPLTRPDVRPAANRPPRSLTAILA